MLLVHTTGIIRGKMRQVLDWTSVVKIEFSERWAVNLLCSWFLEVEERIWCARPWESVRATRFSVVVEIAAGIEFDECC